MNNDQLTGRQVIHDILNIQDTFFRVRRKPIQIVKPTNKHIEHYYVIKIYGHEIATRE